MLSAGLSPLIRRAPSQVVRVHSQQGSPVLGTLHVLFYQFGSDADDVLTFPVLDHVQGLQGTDDVLLGDAGHCTVGGRGGEGRGGEGRGGEGRGGEGREGRGGEGRGGEGRGGEGRGGEGRGGEGRGGKGKEEKGRERGGERKGGRGREEEGKGRRGENSICSSRGKNLYIHVQHLDICERI